MPSMQPQAPLSTFFHFGQSFSFFSQAPRGSRLGQFEPVRHRSSRSRRRDLVALSSSSGRVVTDPERFLESAPVPPSLVLVAPGAVAALLVIVSLVHRRFVAVRLLGYVVVLGSRRPLPLGCRLVRSTSYVVPRLPFSLRPRRGVAAVALRGDRGLPLQARVRIAA